MTKYLLTILRSLQHNRFFAVVVVLTLSLGIGANAAVIFVANALLFRPLPYADSDRVVNLWSPSMAEPAPVMSVSPADFYDWKRRSASFSEMAAFNIADGDLAGPDHPENVAGAMVTTGFFDVLGVQPLLGRTFDWNDDHQSVIVLAYGLWQRDFGGRKSVIGDRMLLSGKNYTIIGVMPPRFVHPEPVWDRTAEYWRPLPDVSRMPRGFRFLRVVARLKPGVSVLAAAAEMKKIGLQLAAEFPQTNKDKTVQVVPLREQMFGGAYRPLFLLLLVGFAVLVVAAANIANLQLARANSRVQQMLLRLALGARTHHIAVWILGESLVLACLGAIGGFLLGYVALYALRLVAPADLRGLDLVTVDGRIALFALLLAALSALLIGLPPVSRLLRFRAGIHGLLSGPYQETSPSRQRTQSLVMAAQLALVLPLLIATLVLARSFFNLVHQDPGFEPGRLLTLRVNLPSSRYSGPGPVRTFFTELLQKAGSAPGVRSAALTSSVPFTEANTLLPVGISFAPNLPADQAKQVYYRVVSEGFFQTMGIPLHSGRSFNEADTESSPPVAIVNRSFAREYLPGQDPIGKPVFLYKQTGPTNATTVAATIVGVAGDVRFESLATAPSPEIYVPFGQDASLDMAVAVRSTGPASGLIGVVRSKAAELDRQLALRDIESMEQIIFSRTSRQRFAVLLITISSVLVFVLALIGAGGIVAYLVSARTKEFGIRMAMGATHGDIIKGVLVHILRFALSGTAAGLFLALAVNRIPANLIYGVRPITLGAFAGSTLVLISTVLLASYFPVRSVLRIDPANSLRTER